MILFRRPSVEKELQIRFLKAMLEETKDHTPFKSQTRFSRSNHRLTSAFDALRDASAVLKLFNFKRVERSCADTKLLVSQVQRIHFEHLLSLLTSTMDRSLHSINELYDLQLRSEKLNENNIRKKLNDKGGNWPSETKVLLDSLKQIKSYIKPLRDLRNSLVHNDNYSNDEYLFYRLAEEVPYPPMKMRYDEYGFKALPVNRRRWLLKVEPLMRNGLSAGYAWLHNLEWEIINTWQKENE